MRSDRQWERLDRVCGKADDISIERGTTTWRGQTIGRGRQPFVLWDFPLACRGVFADDPPNLMHGEICGS